VSTAAEDLNRVASTLAEFHPHLEQLQNNPQRRQGTNASKNQVYDQVILDDIDELFEDMEEEVSRSILFTPVNMLSMGIICISAFLYNRLDGYAKTQ
jgi:hypothetical protein